MNSDQFQLICIVGSSRSGTTMMNRVLGNHSKILGLYELHFIGDKWTTDKQQKWAHDSAIDKAASLLCIARRDIWDTKPTEEEIIEAKHLIHSLEKSWIEPKDVYRLVLKHLMQQAHKSFVLDQTPRNILYAREILDTFPHAKILHMVRDPRAVLYSQRNRWRQRLLGAKNTPLWNMLRVLVNYHPYTTTRLWLATSRLGQLLESENRYMQIKFEEFIKDPQKHTRKICDFIGVEYEDRMLDIPQIGSSNFKHNNQSRGVTAEVIDSWMGNIPHADLWICERLARDYLRDHGFELSSTSTPYSGIVKWVLLYPFHVLGVLIMNPNIAKRILKAIVRKKA